MTSPGTMLQLFGGVSRHRPLPSCGCAGGRAPAPALGATFVFGNLVERSRELAILRVIGWEQNQVRREIAAEMALQGLIAGLLALGLLVAASVLLAHISLKLPASLPGETGELRRRRLPSRRQHDRATGDADGLGLARRTAGGRHGALPLRLVDCGGPQVEKFMGRDQGVTA